MGSLQQHTLLYEKFVLRKYYHITVSGLKRIEEFKNEWREVMSMYQFITKEGAKNE